MSARVLVPVALMAALTAVGAQLRLPLPHVPITLQAAFVCLAGLLLGPWRGAASLGLPVFAGGGGLHYLLKPSAGYLLGFVAGAWLAGRLAGEDRQVTFRRALAATCAGMAAIYAAGVLGLYLNLRFVAASPAAADLALKLGLAPLPKDLLVGLLVAWLAVRLRPVMGSPAG